MKNSKKRRLIAGVMSLAMLSQAIPAMQIPCALTASAAISTDTIQTRVFSYDFGDFKALYDSRTKRWFDEKGKPFLTPDGKKQRIENPEQKYGEKINAFFYDPDSDSLTLGMDDGTEIDPEGILAADTEKLLVQEIRQILALKPEYRSSYYDRAQQKDADVPEPANFPLIYVWKLGAPSENGMSLTAKIYFGSLYYGSASVQKGQISFVRAGENESEGKANPFTVSGDASIDGVQDISDAVLTCRLVAEDATTPVSALGTELADKNEDGMLTSRDITNILFDITHTPASGRGPSSPAGTVPVISAEQIGGMPDDSTARLFGYQTASELADAVRAENGAAFRAFTHCVQDGRNDIWDILYYDKGGCSWHQFNVKSLYLESDGTLVVGADIYADALSAQAPASWVHLKLTVPHGEVPQTMQTAWSLTEVHQPETDAQAPAYIELDHLPAGAVPVSRLVQSSADADEAAKAVGFADEAALLEEIAKMNVNVHQYQKCKEGTEFDTWDLLYIADDSGTWKTDAVQSMKLMPNGRLDLTIDTTYDGETAGSGRHFIRTQITVPHGTLPLDRSTKRGVLAVNYTLNQYDAAVSTKSVRYLSVTDLPANAIPVLHTQTYSSKASEMEATYLKYGVDYNNMDFIMGGAYKGTPVLKTESQEEGCICDRYSVLLTMDPAWGGYNQIALKSLALTADHKLHINTEYTFDKYHYMPGKADNQFLTEVTFTVPHGALPEDLEIEWTNEKRASCQPFVLPEVQYISREMQKPYTEADCTYADVQVDCDETGAVIPAEMRASLEAGVVQYQWHWVETEEGSIGTRLPDPAAAYEWRSYTEPADTDDAEIRSLLSKGNDVTALYYVRNDADMNVHAEDASMANGVLKMTVTGAYTKDNTDPKQTYYRILFVTPDGTLPEVQDFRPEIMMEEMSTDELEHYPIDETKTKRSVRIDFLRPEGLRAEVRVMEPQADGAQIPADVAAELNGKPEGAYTFRQYTGAAQSGNPAIRSLLSENYDVLAVYVSAAAGAYGISSVSLNEGGTLELFAARQENGQQAPESGIWTLLLITEKGVLPQLETVRLRDLGHYKAEDAKWYAVQFPVMKDHRGSSVAAEIRSEAVETVPADVQPYLTGVTNNGECVWTSLLTRPGQTDDPEIKALLAGGECAVVEMYIRDTRAAAQYGVVSAEDNMILLEGWAPANAVAGTCAAHRVLLIADKVSLSAYYSVSATTRYLFPASDQSFFEATVSGTVYLPAEDILYSDQSVMQVLPQEDVEADETALEKGDVSLCTTENEKDDIKAAFGITADWSDKDILQVSLIGEADERFGVCGVRVDERGALVVQAARYEPMRPDDYWENPEYDANHIRREHPFLIVLDQGVLPEITYATAETTVYSSCEIEDSSGNTVMYDALPEFEEIISLPPALVIREQEKCFRMRGEEAGSYVRNTTDLLLAPNGSLLNEGEAVYQVISADSAQSGEFLSVENAASQLIYRRGNAPEMNGADLLLAGFTMSGNVTECGLRYGSYVDKDGVLHLNAAVFRDETKPELNDGNAACVIGIAAESGSFAEITGVVFDEIKTYAGDPEEAPGHSMFSGAGSVYLDFCADAAHTNTIVRFSTEG